MATIQIQQLPPISSGSVDSAADVLAIVDVSAGITNEITVDNLKGAMNLTIQPGTGVGSTLRASNSNIASGNYSAVLSGQCNNATSNFSAVLSGKSNTVSGIYNTIVGGTLHTASLGSFSTIIGGSGHTIVDGTGSVSIGGVCNTITSSVNSTTLEGEYNYISGSNGALMLGGTANSILESSGSSIFSGVLNCMEGATYFNVFYGLQYYSFGNTMIAGAENCMYNTIMKQCNDESGHNFIVGGREACMTLSGYYNVLINSPYSNISGYRHYGNSIVGGWYSRISGSASDPSLYQNAIVGGYDNTISGYAVSSGIFAGERNTVTGPCAVILGSRNSCVDKFSQHGTIVGGAGHCILNSTRCAFIGGGVSNTLTNSANFSSIVGGFVNAVSSSYSATIGGRYNTIPGFYSSSIIVGECITADRSCTTFVNNLSVMSLPTSSAGLPTGSVWRCTVDNTLRIVF